MFTEGPELHAWVPWAPGTHVGTHFGIVQDLRWTEEKCKAQGEFLPVTSRLRRGWAPRAGQRVVPVSARVSQSHSVLA